MHDWKVYYFRVRCMNVCIVCSNRIDASVGGVESVCCNLTEALRKNHDVRFSYIYKYGDEVDNGFRESYLRLPEEVSSSNWNSSLAMVQGFLRDNNVDIIWYHEQNDMRLQQLVFQAGIKENAKLVSVLHVNPHIYFTDIQDLLSWSFFKLCKYGKLFPFLYRLLKTPLLYLKNGILTRKYLRNLFSSSHRVVLLSERFRDDFFKLSGICTSDKVQAISNPILPSEHKGELNKENVVLVVARHVWQQKRIDRIIKIWKKIEDKFEDWKLVIIGNGPAHGDYVKLAEDLKTHRLSFVGEQQPDEYYKKAKILCFSSSSEGFGLVLTEAQQYGCVPIAYRSYSALDDIIVDGETGYSVTPFREEEYIEKLSRLMVNEELRAEMACHAMISVKKFYVDKVSLHWLQLFSSLMIESSVSNKLTASRNF